MYYIYHESKGKTEYVERTTTITHSAPNKRKLCKTRFRNTECKISLGSHFRCLGSHFKFFSQCCRLFVSIKCPKVEFNIRAECRASLSNDSYYFYFVWLLFLVVVGLVPTNSTPEIDKKLYFHSAHRAKTFYDIYRNTSHIVKINDRIRRSFGNYGVAQIQQWKRFV